MNQEVQLEALSDTKTLHSSLFCCWAELKLKRYHSSLYLLVFFNVLLAEGIAQNKSINSSQTREAGYLWGVSGVIND